MKKNNLMAILSLIIAIFSLAVILIWPDGDTIVLGCTIAIIIAIVGIVLGFIGKKQIKSSNEKGKGLALAGIIIGFIAVIWSGIALFGFLAMQDINYNDASLCTMDNMTKDCVDNGDGTSTCRYMDTYDIPCSTDKLKDSQFKK